MLGDSERLRHLLAYALDSVADRLCETGSCGVGQQLLDDSERGHEGNLASGHQGRCGFVEAGAVLDTAHPGLDRIAYALVVVGVDGHIGVPCRSFLNCDSDLFHGELGVGQSIMCAHHSAGDAELQEGGSATEGFADVVSQLVRIARHHGEGAQARDVVAAPQLGGFPFGSVVAMPAGLALNRSARQDSRPSDLALRDRGDDTAVDPAGVTNGGEAGVERRAGRGEDVRRDLGGAYPKREVWLDRARQAQVDVSVDQAGRHRQSLGVETLAVRAGGTESGDAAVLDRDVEVAGVAPRSVDDRRADYMSRSHGRSSVVASRLRPCAKRHGTAKPSFPMDKLWE